MPKLLLFAPCEKILIDQATNGVSLISVLQELHFKVPPGTQLQPNVSLPIGWTAVSLWQEEPADTGVEFEQKLVLHDAASRQLLEQVTKFQFQRPNHRIVANIMGMPTQSRQLTLVLYYRLAGTREWNEVASFPIEVVQEIL